jgi:hypothetical protein
MPAYKKANNLVSQLIIFGKLWKFSCMQLRIYSIHLLVFKFITIPPNYMLLYNNEWLVLFYSWRKKMHQCNVYQPVAIWWIGALHFPYQPLSDCIRGPVWFHGLVHKKQVTKINEEYRWLSMCLEVISQSGHLDISHTFNCQCWGRIFHSHYKWRTKYSVLFVRQIHWKKKIWHEKYHPKQTVLI